jgi:hypothetical protein
MVLEQFRLIYSHLFHLEENLEKVIIVPILVIIELGLRHTTLKFFQLLLMNLGPYLKVLLK